MTITQALKQDPFLVGFDRIFDRVHTLNQIQQKQPNYPPYNIVKTGENRYEVEIAIAGFSRDEIDITVEDGIMKVEGKKNEIAKGDHYDYIHKGIAERDFVRTFTLADTVEVRGADMDSGILSIILENVIPEEKKPRKIAIGQSEAQLLVEDK
jgi:molecular chaperone IbpA